MPYMHYKGTQERLLLPAMNWLILQSSDLSDILLVAVVLLLEMPTTSPPLSVHSKADLNLNAAIVTDCLCDYEL